ncbi:MAG: murein peptide amidase A [Magnetococcales bacterium]|nr:murein peptide amidase A [Magnetococcales bacterium]MBF0322659.1 murein peptide amidase A [Magnetococcales bacterium]
MLCWSLLAPAHVWAGTHLRTTKPLMTPQGRITKICDLIGRKLSSVTTADCTTSGLQITGSRSVNGLPLLLKEYAPRSDKPPQARILVLGGIHGDEYSSISIVFQWMQKLDQFHSGLFHWHVAPLVNPDGLLMPKSQRMNAHGVDLNRNFPTDDWEKESQNYWVNTTGRDPRRFPGSRPLSEPESRWIYDEIESFRPNVIVSVHAPYNLLDFDGPKAKPPHKLGHLYLDPMGTYPGSLGRYAGVEKNIPIITIELTYAGIMPTSNETRNIWTDLIHWINTNITNTPAPAQIAQVARPEPKPLRIQSNTASSPTTLLPLATP